MKGSGFRVEGGKRRNPGFRLPRLNEFLLAGSYFLLPALLLVCASPAFAAGALTGTVTDRTTGKPDAGDTVALIAFGQGMQVAMQTKTDARGRYTLQVPDDSMHLVRVDHQKAAYFEPAPPGTHAVNVDVYDVAANVPGVVTEADVLAMQTAPSGELHVTEDFFVHNASKPALTQFSDHAYEFFLPKGAKVQGTAAMGPGGMPVESTPVPLPGDGHYAFVFPVRPGETRFQVSYTLPYSGKSLVWAQREALETQNLVVMLPKSMQFEPKGTDWQPVPENLGTQVFVHKDVAATTPVGFSIAGQGALPRDAQNGGQSSAQNGAQAAGANGAAADNRPGGGLGPPIDTPDPLHRYKGWLLGGLGVLLLIGAWWLMRSRPAEAAETEREPVEAEAMVRAPMNQPRRNAPNVQRRTFRQALEDALLALERECALGTMEEPELSESRAALQRVLHRILAREAKAEAAAETSRETENLPRGE